MTSYENEKKTLDRARTANKSLYYKTSNRKKGNWSAYFGNDNDIYVEIGCGKGNFIIENAKQIGRAHV